MMNTNPDPPDFKTEFEALGAMWPIVWEAADYGCEATRQYFLETLKVAIDPSLAPDMQRYHARSRLREKGISNAEFMPYEVRRNGIAFGFRHRHIKMWKRGNDLIPRAGKSHAKLSFLGQQPYLPLPGLVQVVQPNRFILYEPDSEFRLQWLWYGLPIGAELDGPTEVYWIEKVTFDQVESLSAQPLIPGDVTEGDNLPLRQRDHPEASEESEGGEQGVGS
jgi:hypothetical protein